MSLEHLLDAGRWTTPPVAQAGLFLRVDDEPFRLVRLAYLDPDAEVSGGIYCAAPTRAGLTVEFTDFRRTAADTVLH